VEAAAKGSGFHLFLAGLTPRFMLSIPSLWHAARLTVLALGKGSRMVEATTKPVNIRNRVSRVVLLALTVWVIVGLSAPRLCMSAGSEEGQPKNSAPSEPEKNFGIKIVSLRPTAGGQMLDLRFQVIDPEKAKAVLDKNKKAYLLDGKTGKTLPVPVTKAGSMRQTTLKPEAGRIYFMLFSNPGGLVKEGGSVSLLIGDFRKDGIVVGSSGAAPAPAGPPALQQTGDAGKP
jgi:hypothetical protein